MGPWASMLRLTFLTLLADIVARDARLVSILQPSASPLPQAAFPLPDPKGTQQAHEVDPLPHHASTSPGSKGAPQTVQVDPSPQYDDALRPPVPKATCKLRIISSCDKYTVAWLHSYADLLATRANSSLLPNGLWDTSDASSDPLNLPITVQAALINQQVVRHASDVRLTLVASPDADENGVALGGRLLAWYKIQIVQEALRRPDLQGCKYIAWIDPDAFLSEPDVDYAAAIDALPLFLRSDRVPSGPFASLALSAQAQDESTGAMTSLPQLAMAASVEATIPGILEDMCPDCHFNGGVLLFNAEHPKLPELLEDWWRAPLTGVCIPDMATVRLAEQSCLNWLVEWNGPTRTQYRHVVGEADFLTINTPAGRMVRHSWTEYRGNVSHEDVFRAHMSMVGLWNHTIARQLLLELPALVTNVSWRLAHNDINEAILLTRQQPRKQQWVPEGSANFHDAGEKAAAQHRSDLWHRYDAPRLPSGVPNLGQGPLVAYTHDEEPDAPLPPESESSHVLASSECEAVFAVYDSLTELADALGHVRCDRIYVYTKQVSCAAIRASDSVNEALMGRSRGTQLLASQQPNVFSTFFRWMQGALGWQKDEKETIPSGGAPSAYWWNDEKAPAFECVQLPNVGREQHSFLEHVTRHWVGANFAREVLFVPVPIDSHHRDDALARAIRLSDDWKERPSFDCRVMRPDGFNASQELLSFPWLYASTTTGGEAERTPVMLASGVPPTSPELRVSRAGATNLHFAGSFRFGHANASCYGSNADGPAHSCLDFYLKVYDKGETRQVPADVRPLWAWAERHQGIPVRTLAGVPICKGGFARTWSGNIMAKPLGFYVGLKAQLEAGGVSPEAGHYMERLMAAVYGPNAAEWCTAPDCM